MNLYAINGQIRDLLESCTDPETGELILDPARLDALQMERDEKIENIACYIKNLAADAEAMRAEEKALEARRLVVERKADRLRRYLFDGMSGEKFNSPRVAINWRKTTSISIDEVVLLSSEKNKAAFTANPEILTYTPKISKAAIKDALLHGVELEGAEIISGLSMSIK